MRRSLFLGSVTLLVAPAAAAASEGDAGLSHFFWEIANLLLLVGVLVYATRKPVSNYLSQRRQDIQDNLAGSEKLLESAEARLAEWNGRAARLDEEVASIKEGARRSAEAERQKVVADAHAAADRIRKTAGAAVESELRRARKRLRGEAADLAVQLAGGILEQKVTSEDQDRLVDEFIEKIEQEGAH